MMHGLRAGLSAALFATLAYWVWALDVGRSTPLELLDVPITFFALGWLSGGFAKGAFGDFNLRRAALRSDLRSAIKAGELVMHYQPLIDASNSRVSGVEVLVRRRSSDGTLVPPAEFIELAEGDPQTIRMLTMAVIETSLRELAPLLTGKWSAIKLSLNLAPANLTQPEVFDHLTTQLRRWGIEAERIQIEVTENGLIEQPHEALEALSSIHDSGAAVALDDFGTGYSNLSRIGGLPVSALKLDDALRDTALMAPLIVLAHQLGLVVIAEHVETAELRESLTRLGCDELQGFFFTEPVPVDQLEAWLDSYSQSPGGPPADDRDTPPGSLPTRQGRPDT
jgi:EAL domain-containing protein (putative c-di-GMP-specific phosphodiesterase class I)